jgi:hypothetical protein
MPSEKISPLLEVGGIFGNTLLKDKIDTKGGKPYEQN